MAEPDDQKDPEPADPGKPKCKAGSKGRSGGQHVTQPLQAICQARCNRAGNQPYDGPESQQKPDLLG
ncbi:hypothetical protein H4CHR_04867 [Variovorax sp. PBS-H4]|nr:hypothetical protein H4CHR_04867 [Variovorax sp. PBS-H4]